MTDEEISNLTTIDAFIQRKQPFAVYRIPGAASEECNVRAEASTDADILGVISAGDQVQKTGTDGEWVQIDYDGQTGYIRGDLLE